MRAFLHRLVERLHDVSRPLSRNRHFHVFEGPAKGALRIDKHLRDLELHLERFQTRGVRPEVHCLPDGRLRLILRDATRALVRTAILTPSEVELLCRHPAGAWALSGLAVEPASKPGRTGSRD